MKILGIDTTGVVASVAVVDENITICEFTTNFQKNHSVVLMPLIEEMLHKVELTLSDMDYIACSQGPGSFTGLRIGVATAKGLAHGAGKKIVPVPTLDALAYNLCSNNRIIVPIMDARRNQVYTAFYKFEKKLVRVSEYYASDITEVLEMLKKFDEPPIFLGDGILTLKESIKGFELAPAHLNMQRAAAVASLAKEKLDEAVNYNEFEPFYLRKPQAEREYLEREKNERV